jgi:hypothetical protein
MATPASEGARRSDLARQIEHFAGFFFERGADLRFAEAARDYFLGDLLERRLGLVVRSVIKVHGKFLLLEGEFCCGLCLVRAHC